MAGERQSYKDDTDALYLESISDNIVIALCFDCHGRVWSEIL